MDELFAYLDERAEEKIDDDEEEKEELGKNSPTIAQVRQEEAE